MEILSQLHPPVVHFAVALIIVGVLFDTAGYFLKKDHLKHAGFWTIVFGMLAVWGAAFTGHQAEEIVEEAIKGTVAYELLEKHEEIGEILPWIVTVLALLRSYLFFKPKNSLFLVYILAGIITASIIGLQGRIGGKLVYEYGVGVKVKNIQTEYHHHEDD